VGFEKLLNTLRNLREEISKATADNRSGEAAIDLDEYKSRFVSAMNDDFNTPQAVAVLFDLARETNALLSLESRFSAESLRRIEEFFEEFGGRVLGAIPLVSASLMAGDAKTESNLVQLLVDLRTEVRSQKLWPLSDKIRDGLTKLGVTIEDKKDGTSWRKG
jgi:cysteinyl-tRNA synthetase